MCGGSNKQTIYPHRIKQHLVFCQLAMLMNIVQGACNDVGSLWYFVARCMQRFNGTYFYLFVFCSLLISELVGNHPSDGYLPFGADVTSKPRPRSIHCWRSETVSE